MGKESVSLTGFQYGSVIAEDKGHAFTARCFPMSIPDSFCWLIVIRGGGGVSYVR
jgi:hypothetical protein